MAGVGAKVRAFLGRQTYNYYAASARYYQDHGQGIKPILHLYGAVMVAGIFIESQEHHQKEMNAEYFHRKDTINTHSAQCAEEERTLATLNKKELSDTVFRGTKKQYPAQVTWPAEVSGGALTYRGLPGPLKVVTELQDPVAFAKENKHSVAVALAKAAAPAGKEAQAVRIAEAAFPFAQ